MPSSAAPSTPNFGLAWLLLCFAFVLHVWDEAAHNFLYYYNATSIAIHTHYPWIPRGDMSYPTFLYGLIAANIILLALTPFAFRNARWLRPLAYLAAVIQTLNGLNHTVMTIRGHSIDNISWPGPAPGFYSSPALLLASAYLFWSLHRTPTLRTKIPSSPR